MHSVLKEALLTRQTAASQLTELYRRYERCFGDYFSIAECQSHCDTYYREYDEPDYNHLAPPSNWQRGQRQGQQQHQSGRRQPPGNKKQLTQLPTLAPKPKPKPPSAAAAVAALPTAKTDAHKFAETKASNFKYSSEFSVLPFSLCSLFILCPSFLAQPTWRQTRSSSRTCIRNARSTSCTMHSGNLATLKTYAWSTSCKWE